MFRVALGVAAIAAVFAGVAGAAQAVTGPSPRQAAQAAKACFAQNGWSAQLLDSGVTVVAQGPRKPRGQRRAWYSVVFRSPALGAPTSSSELAFSLDSRERRTASTCRSAAWR